MATKESSENITEKVRRNQENSESVWKNELYIPYTGLKYDQVCVTVIPSVLVFVKIVSADVGIC